MVPVTALTAANFASLPGVISPLEAVVSALDEAPALAAAPATAGSALDAAPTIAGTAALAAVAKTAPTIGIRGAGTSYLPALFS